MRNLTADLLIFVLVTTIGFIVGNRLDARISLPKWPTFPFNLFAGIVIFFSGLSLGIRSARLLYNAGPGLPWSELCPMARSSRLVTSGPYAYSRNPIILGYSLLPFGMGIMFQSPSITILATAVVLLSALLLLKIREEPGLQKRFGTTYAEYKRRTPVLIPRPALLLALVKSKFLSRGCARNGSYRSPNLLVLASVGISVFGLYILSVMTFNLPNVAVQSFGKELLLLSFAGICIFGVVAGLSPSKLSRIRFFGGFRDIGSRKTLSEDKSLMGLRGHHPTCARFSSHVLRLKGQAYCAGCSGLVAGALVSLAGCLAYLLVGFDGGEFPFKLGVAFILCGLLQHSILDFDNAVLHCILNVLLVVGTFLALIGLIGINNNPSVEVYFLLLTVNLVGTRMMLSRLVHRKTCAGCVDRCAAAFM